MSPRSPRHLDNRARRQIVGLAGLMAISVLLVGVGRTPIGRRIQNGFNYVMDPVVSGLDDGTDTAISVWNALFEINQLREENDTLSRENELLRNELARMPAVQRLYDDWTKITQTQQAIPFQSTRCRVLMRQLSDVGPRVFIIDKGARDGLKVGLVVIGDGGSLVGRIESVEDRVSTVTLLTNLTSVVYGREESTGAIGRVQGQPGGLLSMSFTAESAKVQAGQVIVTAGETVAGTNIQSPYPPGLLIGTLSVVSPDAIVTPSADLGSMTFALVILDYQGGLPLPSVSPSPGPSASPSATPK